MKEIKRITEEAVPVQFLTSLSLSEVCAFNKALNLTRDIYIKKSKHLLFIWRTSCAVCVVLVTKNFRQQTAAVL